MLVFMSCSWGIGSREARTKVLFYYCIIQGLEEIKEVHCFIGTMGDCLKKDTYSCRGQWRKLLS